MKITTRTVKLTAIKPNPDNPRTITGKKMTDLVKSLTSFPEMLNIREIVVDETMTILGGNMRYLALKKSGAKECTAKIVSGLTPEQKRRFIISDNGSWGEWNMDELANKWDDLPLAEWGVEIPADWNQSGEPKEKEGLEGNPNLIYQIIVECDSEKQQAELLEQLTGDGLRCRPLIL